MDGFRASYGEKITSESWVMRDLWRTTNIDYGAKLGLAKQPKKLQSTGIKRLIERGLWEQGIRRPLTNGNKRHEWKTITRYAKNVQDNGEQYMRPINVEICMGHDIGVSASYYRPKEHEVLQDYLKAAPHLSIRGDKKVLEKQIYELTEKQDEIALMRLKHEREMREMKDRQELIIQTLIDSGQLKPNSTL